MSDLEERIKAAILRITSGQCSMRVPAEESDPDLVLADCMAEIRRLRVNIPPNWQSIDTAPRDGSPIIGFSPGVGCPILIRWVAPQEFMTTSECERYMDGCEAHEVDEAEKWLETPEWWAADFNSGDMLSDDCKPTHWMPLPACPEVK